jgi:hypothetical protein
VEGEGGVKKGVDETAVDDAIDRVAAGWYEVVETTSMEGENEEGEEEEAKEQGIALYQTLEEAEFCKTFKEERAERRNKESANGNKMKSTWEVRQRKR